MPTGQTQHSMEKIAKPRWSAGREGCPHPSLSRSLSLDDMSCGWEKAWVGICAHCPVPHSPQRHQERKILQETLFFYILDSFLWKL